MAQGNLLVVEDSIDLLEMLGEILADIGFNVMLAPDGDKAKEILKTQPVDMVLTDGKYPGGGALGLLGFIRSEDRLKEMPVVVLTGGLAERMDPIFKDVPILDKPAPTHLLVTTLEQAKSRAKATNAPSRFPELAM